MVPETDVFREYRYYVCMYMYADMYVCRLYSIVEPLVHEGSFYIVGNHL